jgi:hypothetical protein
MLAFMAGLWQTMSPGDALVGLVPISLTTAVLLVLLTRLGLLASVVTLFGLLLSAVFLPDVTVLSGWPSHVTWTIAAVNLALAVYGLVVSVGKEPLVPWAALDRGETGHVALAPGRLPGGDPPPGVG